MLAPTNSAVPCTSEGIARAVVTLRGGGLVGLPTETVYGLAADARNEVAVNRVFEVKGRPADHPLIVHIAQAAELEDWAHDIPEYAQRLAAQLWPGPLTLVLPAQPNVVGILTGGQNTIGIRMPAHEAASNLIQKAGAVAAPSANRFGRVSPTNASAVVEELAQFLDEDDLVLDGGDCSIGIESTIVDCTGARPRILRPGLYSEDVILSQAGIDEAPKTSAEPHGDSPRVSGSLPGHYAPRTPVSVISATDLAKLDAARLANAFVIAPADVALLNPAKHIVQPNDTLEFARMLYASLREADHSAVSEVLVVAPPAQGIGIAIADRLQRAAHGSNNTNP